MGRSKLPEGTKRIKVFGRVDPATVEFLDSLGEKNYGRAVDRAANLARAMREGIVVWAKSEPAVPATD